MAKDFKIEGMDKLQASFKALGKVPMKVVTPAARAGGRVALKAAKANAPVDSGDLKGALILKGERSGVPGKKVYDVMVDPAKNDLFVDVSADGKRSYYPASQEYGFIGPDGNFVPGYRYMERAITENVSEITKKVTDTAMKGIDKALGKG